MICQDMQYHLVKFNDCLSPLDSKEPTCPLVTCNTDSYISTPAGLLLRTSEPIVTVASKKSETSGKTHPHLQTTSSVTELKVPSYQVKFIRWTTNVTSVAFGKMIIHSPTNADPESIIYKQPPMSAPKIHLKDWITIRTDVGPQSVADSLQQFQKDIEELKRQRQSIKDLPQVSTAPLQKTIDHIWSIPRYLKIALIVLPIIVLFAAIKMLKDFIAPTANLCPSSCCKRSDGRTRPIVRFANETDLTHSANLPRSESHISLVVNTNDSIPRPPNPSPTPYQVPQIRR